MSSTLLSSTYFGPIQWYQKLNRYDIVKVEAYDSFIKQTYRNRCVIATANGPQTLTVPVERSISDEMGNISKCLMKDVRISDHGNWQHIHWNALQSAYGESPFFEFLADDIRPFFEHKWTFLYDFNMEICAKICDLIDIKPTIVSTTSFVPLNDSSLTEITDFRDTIRPKHPLQDKEFSPKPYYQTYRHKQDFIPNLSILDLLFNMGKESIFYL